MNENHNPVRLGLVGLNFGAELAERQIIGAPAERFVKITAVCDRDHDKAAAYAAKHALPVFAGLEELLASADIEAVMLMTPPAGRAGLVRKCLEAGKHVLTTKPFELDPAAALKVLREARERGLTVHLNSPAPLPSSDLEQIRRWQHDFNLGRPVAGHWETYAKYDEHADGSWFDSFEKCPAAPIFRIGIYGINELIAVMGEVESVEVVTGRISTGRPTPDNAQLMIRFAGGAIGSVYSALCIGDGTLYPAALTLHFENGTIYKTQVRRAEDREFTAIEMRLRTLIDGRLHEENTVLPAENRSGSYQYENFYRAIREGRNSGEVSPEAIAAGIKVIAQMAQKERV